MALLWLVTTLSLAMLTSTSQGKSFARTPEYAEISRSVGPVDRDATSMASRHPMSEADNQFLYPLGYPYKILDLADGYSHVKRRNPEVSFLGLDKRDGRWSTKEDKLGPEEKSRGRYGSYGNTLRLDKRDREELSWLFKRKPLSYENMLRLNKKSTRGLSDRNSNIMLRLDKRNGNNVNYPNVLRLD